MKCPGFGVYRQDYYTDIAIATGATFVAKEVNTYHVMSYIEWGAHPCVRITPIWPSMTSDPPTTHHIRRASAWTR